IDPTTHRTMFRLPMPCAVSSCTVRFCGSVTYGEPAGGAAWAAVLPRSAAATAARIRLLLFMRSYSVGCDDGNGFRRGYAGNLGGRARAARALGAAATGGADGG